MNTVHFETLGCKLNQIETESLAAAFKTEGWRIDGAEESHTASSSLYLPVGQVALSIVNTCTVTGKAEQKARRIIRKLLSLYPEAPLLVTGCYAEVEQDTINNIDGRIHVFPGSRKGELARLPGALSSYILQHPHAGIRDALSAFCLSASTNEENASAFNLATDTFFFHSRASIKIQDGCGNHCSYCRIRLARGKPVSLEASEVISQVRKIEEAGWAEVILTGVNLSHFRSGSFDFADLLALLLRETNKIGIRISSLYPERIDEAILPMLTNPRIRPHFHLSVQSGSDKILTLMERPYTAQTVRDAVTRLRGVKENPFIACDIITGFPGETDEDFDKTLDLCKDLRFAWIHAFPFSARPGTKAWDMRPKVPERVSGERCAQLSSLAEKAISDYEAYWVGRPLSAILEKGETDEYQKVITENYLSLIVPRCGLPGGSEVSVIPLGQGKASLALLSQV